MMLVRLGPQKAVTTIAIRMYGNEYCTSATRMNAASSAPPR